MIVKCRSKTVILGKPQTVFAEACTLIFALRKALSRAGMDEAAVDKVMEIIGLAADSRNEEEHLRKLDMRFEKEATKDGHADQN